MVDEGVTTEPTKDQEEYFADMTVYGDVAVEEFSGLDNQLSPQERMQAIAGIEGDVGKRFVVITNQRVLAFSSDDVVPLGATNEYTDLKIDTIHDIKVENRKDFDVLTLKTPDTNERLMVPVDTGVRIAGIIRDVQKAPDPTEQLQNLSEEKEKGNISEEEFERKKQILLDEA